MILIPFLVYCLAWMDAEHYDKKQWVTDKASRIYTRLSILTIISLFNWYIGIYTLFVFGGLFDIALNWKRKHVRWNHIGSNYESENLKFDDLMRKYAKYYIYIEFSQLFVALGMLHCKVYFTYLISAN